MKTYLECYPCFLNQSIAACKMLHLSENECKTILNKVALLIPEIDTKATPPEIGSLIHKIIREETSIQDPYKEIKRHSNQLALKIYSHLKNRVIKSDDPLLTAVKLAIAGNIIDYGAITNLDIEKEIAKILQNEDELITKEKQQYFSYQPLKKSIESAKTLLYLGDNAGEIIFDKILLEEIKTQNPQIKIHFAVRGGPIINDALEEDAITAGIHNIAEIINNGATIPGTIIDKCSEPFKKIWQNSNLIISKGQGNFESLHPSKANIYYMLIVKCQVLARDLGCSLRDIILYHEK
ncbi:MAG: DUF89 family protein [Spirochaetales bacterium]|nr:DUF89 family protein [Spirochaetales bacterium]